MVGAVLLITWRQWWPQVGHFLANLDILAATGLVAIAAVIVALGGYADDPADHRLSDRSPSEPATPCKTPVAAIR